MSLKIQILNTYKNNCFGLAHFCIELIHLKSNKIKQKYILSSKDSTHSSLSLL